MESKNKTQAQKTTDSGNKHDPQTPSAPSAKIKAELVDTTMLDASPLIPVQIKSPPDIIMRDAGTGGRFSLVSEQLSPGNETLESLPSPSQSRAPLKHLTNSPLSSHRFINTHDQEATLTRAFEALNVDQKPRILVSSDTDKSTKTSSASHEDSLHRSTFLSDSASTFPADLETSTPIVQRAAVMDFSSMSPSYYYPIFKVSGPGFDVPGHAVTAHQPGASHYIPMYKVQGYDFDIPGHPITQLPDSSATESATVNEPTSEEDETPRPGCSNQAGSKAVASDGGPTNEASDDEETGVSKANTETSDFEGFETDESGEGVAQAIDDNGIFLPTVIKNVKYSDNFPPDTMTLGLPAKLHREWAAKGYQRDWIKEANASDEILDGFTSKYKFDDLVSRGAFEVDDKFVYETKDKDGNVVVKMGQIMAYGKIKVPEAKKITQKLPDMALFVDNEKKAELKACKGPSELLEALSALEPRLQGPAPKGVWKLFKVRRDEEDLGSIYQERQRYHRWEIEQDAWEEFSGECRREKREGGPRKPKAEKKGKKQGKK